MNREDARRELLSGNPRLRLDAARFFAGHAEPNDRPLLVSALKLENVAWVRRSLETALHRLAPRSEEATTSGSITYDPDLELTGLRADAQVRITGQLLHELEPLVGILRVRLQSEWSEFPSSNARHAMERIESFLEALRELNTASRVPTFEEVSLRTAMQELVEELLPSEATLVGAAGPEMTVSSNKTFVQLVVRNGLRNALDATSVAQGNSVAVSWGHTSKGGYFVSVVDRGSGPPHGAEQNAFTMGTSTKPGHLGMGLAIANEAAEALGGKLTLRQGSTGGAVLELRVGGST
jgi:signal transduction histidine kinase